MAIKKAKIITITSVKGGTGKTTTVLNLAGVLSKLKKKTLILDLDLYSGSIAASLNLNQEKDIYTMCDDMMNSRFTNIEDYIQSYNEYIDIIAAPIDPRSVSKISTSYIDVIITRTAPKYDIILIDTNHILGPANLIALDHSDKALYVMTNDLMDIKNMKTMVSIFKNMNLNNQKIILNEARLNNTKYTIYDINNLIDKQIDYIISKHYYNKHIEDYVYNGKIITLENNLNKDNTYIKIVNDIIKE